MFTVTKSFKIPIGHRLSKLVDHKCFSYHGHNIKIDVEIQREKLNNNDMVIDFYDLKKIVNETIIDNWDHAMLLNSKDIYVEFSKNQRTYYFECGDPTSENMCFVLYNILFMKFKDFDKELRLKSITIWESDESKATYMVD